ncbi:GTP-binding protein Era [Litorivivens lipolytica]|uniref:GTPase Era n=1 Tax=Litorivivens lipolytica TaxID=1524264 RepID=A0A7W4W2L1_9GAMM|nr:GTPase Era [Litorivivens lipolytica]MBB3046003.1 GTP-binding protein Era [Litorivivens lipolytica]
MTESRCGYIAIVGRPNVGKSTLLNHILGQKISITSRKPQTTRHRVLGIKTRDQIQAIYVDTPGLHRGQKRAINRYMNRAATTSLRDVDVIAFVIEAGRWTEEDAWVLEQLKNYQCPVLLVINKVDKLEDKAELLPFIAARNSEHNYAQVVPVSALRADNLTALEQTLDAYLPEGPHFFDEEQITDRSMRFLTAEIVREKITRQLGDELPYAMTVEIEQYKLERGVTHISAAIYVERDGQKKILIGKGGSRLKSIGREARLDIEKLIDGKVMLNLWVKIKSGWSDDERALRSLGYDDE